MTYNYLNLIISKGEALPNPKIIIEDDDANPMIGKAFAPAHITAFFEICDKAKELRRRGSRGAGICLSRGTVTQASVDESDMQSIKVYLNGREAMALTTCSAVKKLIGSDRYSIEIECSFELPIAQGFGMSGSGALSAVLAVSKALNLNLTFEELIAVAHESEVEQRTGLGDVVAQGAGGIPVRRIEGAPPFGMVESTFSDKEIVLCIVGEEIETKAILNDPLKRERINYYGRECLRRFIANPEIDNLVELSYEFALRTGLMSQDVKDAVDACRDFGRASMSMLGNSVFAVGETEELISILREFGDVFQCTIGERARVLD